MEDNGNIIYYIILGAIYLLSKAFGKKKKKPLEKPRQERKIVPPTTAKEEPEPISFEEILRELAGTKQPEPEPDPEPVPTFIPAPAPMPAIEQTPEYSYSVDEMDEIAVDYEVPEAIGANVKTKSKIKRKVLTFERDEHFTIKQKRTVDFIDLLSEQDGAAKAFVLSEIFARKN